MRLINYIRIILERLYPPLKTKRLFKERCNLDLDLNNPKRIMDKVLYTKLYVYWNNRFISSCVDKYTVRSFIKKMGCEEILLKLYGVYDNPEQINWDILPNSFVIKTNHGCGYNIICKEKASLNIGETKKKLKNWLNTSFGKINAEEGIYDKIKRKIIIEEFINTDDGKAPTDYKLFCTYGKVTHIFVCSDRYGNVKRSFYWPNWEKIPVTQGPYESTTIEKPEGLDKMIKYAEKLSKKFPIVRVDLYYNKGTVYFGELTFTPDAGMYPYHPEKYNYIFGDLFPNKKDLVLRKK